MTPEQTIRKIAREILLIETLDQQKRDSLDFHDVAVWSIRKALLEAYAAGFSDARTAHSTRPTISGNDHDQTK